MAFLSQFLASLSNEISKAKILSDLNTARQASRFLNDDFLRNLPITRMDFDHVNLHFKMAIGELTSTPQDSPFLSSLTTELTRSLLPEDKRTAPPKASPKTLSKVSRQEKEQKIQSLAVGAVVQSIVPELANIDPANIQASSQVIAEKFKKNFTQSVTTANITIPHDAHTIQEKAGETFHKVFNKYFISYKDNLATQLLKELGQLNVIVEGDKLKSFPPDALVDIELQLLPKTYHWSLKPEYTQKVNDQNIKEEDKYVLMPGS